MKFKTETKTPLDREIESVIETLKDMGPYTEEYKATAENLKTLIEARAKQRERIVGVSRDNLVIAATNLAGILAILNAEKLGAVTSKATGFVAKAVFKK